MKRPTKEDRVTEDEKMTMRDEFAMIAMQGLISNSEWMTIYGSDKYLMSSEITAQVAYGYADAMLKQREL